ncbi:MAG: amidohydrolase family protein [Archangium sp.]|nr:amidohydrolase family protein [Archangium sp.]
MKRRTLLAGLAATSLSSCFRLARPPPLENGILSAHARWLWRRAWKELDPARVLDTHTHVVGLGHDGTGCEVNPSMTKSLRFGIYVAAAGIQNIEEHADQQYVDTLVTRLRSQLIHGRSMILGFDRTYGEDGKVRPELTEFHTPNAYVARLSREYPDLFVPCASVHPYRPDAIEALHEAAESGCIAVKWLPNAMQMNPGSAKCDAFYEAMVKLGLPLLTHAGEEKAVEAEEAQRFGNPLHLRRPLDHGVKVLVAHCASLGENPDLDLPDAGADKPWVDNFDLFTRLMEEKRYEGKLFGEISAMTQANRAGKPIITVMKRKDWHARLVNGSDYPLPAITVLIQTSKLVKLGLLTERERLALNELDQHNPLEFDFVVKRTLSFREGDVVHRLPDAAFTWTPSVFPRLRSGSDSLEGLVSTSGA